MKVKLMVASFYIVGLLFLSLGISMMILANLGAGPWDAMYVGLSEAFWLDRWKLGFYYWYSVDTNQ